MVWFQEQASIKALWYQSFIDGFAAASAYIDWRHLERFCQANKSKLLIWGRIDRYKELRKIWCQSSLSQFPPAKERYSSRDRIIFDWHWVKRAEAFKERNPWAI